MVELEVFQLGKEWPETVADHGAGMGVVGTMYHEDGNMNLREDSGIDAFRLKTDHVCPRLLVRDDVAGERFIGRMRGVEGIHGLEQLARHQEALVGVVPHLFEVPESATEVWCHTLINDLVEVSTSVGVEGSAADENQRTDEVGVLGGVGQRKHGAPGMADERGSRIIWVGKEEVMEVVYVKGNREGNGAAGTLEGFEDAE